MPHRLKPAGVEVRRADLTDADLVGGLTERVYRQGGWTAAGCARRNADLIRESIGGQTGQ